MRIWVMAVLAVGLAAVGHGQTPATNDHLKPILWMAGDWEGVEKDSDGSLKVILHVRVSDNGQALLYDASFLKAGKVQPKYQGMYYWDPSQNAIAMTQVSENANVAHGTYTPAGDSGADQYVRVAAENTTFELQSHYTVKKESFHFVGQFRPAGKQGWVPAVDVTYRRVAGK